MADTVGTNTISDPSVNPKASVIKALQEIAKRKLTGQLTIHNSQGDSVPWRVYCGSGLIHFATSVIGQQERLTYLLQRYHPEILTLSSTEFQFEYQYICHYWQSGQLSLQQVRQLLFSLTQEAITKLLALPEVQLSFEKKVGLDPLILSVNLKQTVMPLQDSIKRWMQLQPEIISPFQRFLVTDQEQLVEILQLKTKKSERHELLSQALSQNLCLYELAYQLKRDASELAAFLQPFIRTGVVSLHPYRTSQTDERPIIACIDDSKTVQRNVKLVLESSGYQVLGLMEPARALTTLVRSKPALILMDISMPEVDGYELCRMLRQSSVLKETPIVMLTGRDGLIDRIRARMVGANDYITKPFHPQQLLTIIQKVFTSCQLEGN